PAPCPGGPDLRRALADRRARRRAGPGICPPAGRPSARRPEPAGGRRAGHVQAAGGRASKRPAGRTITGRTLRRTTMSNVAAPQQHARLTDALRGQPKSVWVTAFAAVIAFMGIGLVDPILNVIT